MKTCPSSPIVRLALLAVLLILPLAAAAQQTGTIAFSRTTDYADHTLRSSSLFRTNATGSYVGRLTPTDDGLYQFSPSWSSTGRHLVFSRGRSSHPYDDRYNLFTINRRGGALHRITSGIGNFEQPVWGPGARIAFVSQFGDQWCLSIVRWDGTHQHNLFCPDHHAEVFRPTWSADGTSLYIDTGYYGSGLEPPYYSRAYRVNAGTGAPTLLTSQMFDDAVYLTFAPDGIHGLYADIKYNPGQPITAVNFITDVLTPIGPGYSPLYSKDGSHIAFTRQTLEGAPDFLVYAHLYVMNADGSDEHQLTHARIQNLEVTAADWSGNGDYLLANRTIYMEDGALLVGHTRLRIIEVATGTQTHLPSGTASEGAWYQP